MAYMSSSAQTVSQGSGNSTELGPPSNANAVFERHLGDRNSLLFSGFCHSQRRGKHKKAKEIS
jgi:hypothetical protein